MTSSKPRTVWIVDDSPTDAERARRVLLGQYAVQVFHDGSDALECLTGQEAPDVMVLDWVMPGITGVEVCRFLRSRAYASSPIGIVLLTAHRAVEQIVEGLSAGANDYLSKPYEDEELRARVMSQIRARELLDRALEAEDTNRRLLESAPDAMVAIDEHGRLTFANREACKILNGTREALLGHPISTLIPGLTGLLGRTSGEVNRTLPDVEIGGRMFSPTVRLPVMSMSAVVTVSLRDVTERRRLDTRRLDFYSMVAHDLRSPLNVMSLRADLLLSGQHGELAPLVATDIHKIKDSIQSLVTMINDFLEIARFEGTRLEIDQEPVDVAALIDTTMESFRPSLERSQIDWHRRTCEPPDDCIVIGDYKRLSQVFSNLLGNAIKFTAAHGTITTSLRLDGAWVEIAVQDTGRGVPPEALPTLFERYTRAPGQNSDIAGSGLGLMIVREIVEAHGGSVGVESRVGEGSRFWVRLMRHVQLAAQ